MFENPAFGRLVEQNHPTGEVFGVDRFLVRVRGLEGVPSGALILFENGAQGMVREAGPEGVIVLNFDSEDTPLGMLAVLQDDVLSVGVGPALVGRVVSALGRPLDGKGPLNLAASQPVFGSAPGIMERSLLGDQLVTGVAAVDMLFPIVLGQRIAVLGDAKSGKSTFLTQMTVSQKDTGRVVIYVLISKRKVDIDNLIGILESSGAIKHTIVVVASVFDSLAQSYLAPYAAAAMGEYLWGQGRDVVMVYDDLSNHAKIYREVALLGRTYPGRDSYPGDMFYAHSSLLERAGKLASSGKTLTAIPVVVTPNDDITAYLPTSIMSITDGQIIFDLGLFRQGIRPAVSAGLSVSRVGGRAQTARQKELTGLLFKKLAAYRQAAEFSHFGSELAIDSQADLELGKWVYEALKQLPQELYSLVQQELMLAAVVATEGKTKLDIDSLKRQAGELGNLITNDKEYPAAIKKLLKDNSVQAAK
ncbi:MAG TPA: sodium-transporting two-sector ATPase [Candidatus Saccharimonadales bacterium]|nr:sodium-transporting two-sector ATPase [Candidatus Saccharimonadales bacterium]